MKKIYVSLFAIASLAACKKDCDKCQNNNCSTPSPDSTVVCKTDLSKGLLAYYPFNGNFNDESGNGNNATAQNGAFLTTDYVGRANSCAGFDGYNDYLIVPASSKLNSDTVTVSLQVMLNIANRQHTFYSRVNFDNATAAEWGIGTGPDNKFSFSTRPNTEDCSQLATNSASYSLYANNNYQTGRWYNMVTTFVGGVQKLYINGVLQASATKTFTKVKKCDLANLVIGGWWKSDIVSIDGKIDDVRLYNRALTDCEISKLAESFKD